MARPGRAVDRGLAAKLLRVGGRDSGNAEVFQSPRIQAPGLPSRAHLQGMSVFRRRTKIDAGGTPGVDAASHRPGARPGPVIVALGIDEIRLGGSHIAVE